MKEVFIAKNGRPYIKDEQGKVRFISSAEWEQYKTVEEGVKQDRRWLFTALVVLGVSIYIGTNLGAWL